MESYYRDRFWAPILGYNQLSIYLSHQNDKGASATKEPRLCMSQWDFFAVSVLSHYLSKRKIIGEYPLVSLAGDEKSTNAKQLNFICVGSVVKPLGKNLPCDIYEKICGVQIPFENQKRINIIHQRNEFSKGLICDEQKGKIFKGFLRFGDENIGIFTHQPSTKSCAMCRKTSSKIKEDINIFYHTANADKAPCQFMSDKHIEIAQLILWRDDSDDENQSIYFRVGIIGCSGPATSALSVLFVDEEEIENQLLKDKKKNPESVWKKGHLLCELQRLVRKKIMELFLDELHKIIKEKITVFTNKPVDIEEQQEKYYALVRHAVVSYLKTVLYRYFFPLLSEIDIERIYNGMYTFTNSMKAARTSPFALNYHTDGSQSVVRNEDIEAIVDEIPKLLRDTLKGFRGIEAFYKVDVEHFLDNFVVEKDTRRIEKIELLEKNGEPQINYLFIPMPKRGFENDKYTKEKYIIYMQILGKINC